MSYLETYDDLGFYPIHTPWVEALLRKTLDPLQLFQREGYTEDDVINFLEANYSSGYTSFFGSPKANVLIRLYQPNAYVMEPHICGNGYHIRPVMKHGIDFVFNSTKVTKFNIYTHLKSVKKVALGFGFSLEGTLTNTYLHNNHLTDVYVLGLDKKDYAKQ